MARSVRARAWRRAAVAGAGLIAGRGLAVHAQPVPRSGADAVAGVCAVRNPPVGPRFGTVPIVWAGDAEQRPAGMARPVHLTYSFPADGVEWLTVGANAGPTT
jgi:hypothetical protein